MEEFTIQNLVVCQKKLLQTWWTTSNTSYTKYSFQYTIFDGLSSIPNIAMLLSIMFFLNDVFSPKRFLCKSIKVYYGRVCKQYKI